jgi:hypothetical protein
MPPRRVAVIAIERLLEILFNRSLFTFLIKFFISR